MPTPKVVLKRDGNKEIFNKTKIRNAINKAFVKGKLKNKITCADTASGTEISTYDDTPVNLDGLVTVVLYHLEQMKKNEVSINEIQESVIRTLTSCKYGPVATAYRNYMKHRDSVRATSLHVSADADINKKMLVIKKSGVEEEFNRHKIESALAQACVDLDEKDKLGTEEIKLIAEKVAKICASLNRALESTEIKDILNNVLYGIKPILASAMINYSLKKTNAAATMLERVKAIVRNQNEEVKQENSNKNPTIASTQRDYLAGEVSRTVTMEETLDKDVVGAHKEGIIHFHDADYELQPIFNCMLVNLEDMLQNGTVISRTMIEKPHTFKTACNIASQIAAQIASNQYGGQSISIMHLAPFIKESRAYLKNKIKTTMTDCGIKCSEKKLNEFVEVRLKDEIRDGVQLLQYQVNTLLTSNGQTPFITFFMYLNETKDEELRKDMALIIEEILKQRIKGVKNEQGAWVSPTFPKLIYCLDATNCDETKPYWYLTELAAECTAKRMVPDYISEKMMLQLKLDKNGNGNCYTCMGGLLKTTAHVKLEERMTKRCELIAC